MWGSFEFTPSLSEGVYAPKAVRLVLMEKVWVLRGDLSFMHLEREKPLSVDLKGLGVHCSGTFWPEGVRCLSFQRATMIVVQHPGGSRALCGVALFPV
jgi:hypothetical protein